MKYFLLASLFLLSGCPDTGDLGGPCDSNAQCDISWGEYCNKPGCDLSGVCEIKPTQTECSHTSPYLVCGCNDKEYLNSCWAAEDRQSIKNYGPCEE